MKGSVEVCPSVLITQCLQSDFVKPLEPYEPLPNSLHVGSDEALRLVGADPGAGPLAQLMGWAARQGADELAVIEIRDWHDPDDPAQRDHLLRFGSHCLQDSEGAAFAVEWSGRERYIVDSINLNDFEGTRLGEILDGLCSEHGRGRLRIGVVGVWTEAKVTFLLYDLLTRGYAAELATCSALTASASRAQHFNALEQLRKLLGVRVFDSIGEFTSWLLPRGKDFHPVRPGPARARSDSPEIRVDGPGLDENDSDIVSYLFRDSARLHLSPLGGGFSGALVYLVEASDCLGHNLYPTVLKLADRSLIAKERVAFERVEGILGNSAPRIRGFVDLGERAGIRYAYAAMGPGRVETFKSMYEGGANQERIDAVLSEVFEKILGRFYAAAQYERLSLLEYYTFDSRYAASVRDKIQQLVGPEGAAQTLLSLPGGFTSPNPADFYENALDGLPRPLGEYHLVSYVHGDLNGANILLDSHENVWLIDFFHTHRGHLVRDLAKLENDLLFIFTPLRDDDDLAEAFRITEALDRVADLRAPLPALPAGVTNEWLRRAWNTLVTLRGLVSSFVRSERNPIHYRTALLRYAVHTLSFDESSRLQKLWALGTAGTHARALLESARYGRELRVDWIDAGQGRIGLTICPGRRDRQRDMGRDIDTLAGQGVSLLVGCLTRPEMERLGVGDLPSVAERAGIEYHHLPVMDQAAPGRKALRGTVKRIRDFIDRGADVVVHCLGGLGRSGTVAACVLKSLGQSTREALASVRSARGPRAVETRAQESFVASFTGQSGQ